MRAVVRAISICVAHAPQHWLWQGLAAIIAADWVILTVWLVLVHR